MERMELKAVNATGNYLPLSISLDMSSLRYEGTKVSNPPHLSAHLDGPQPSRCWLAVNARTTPYTISLDVSSLLCQGAKGEPATGWPDDERHQR